MKFDQFLQLKKSLVENNNSENFQIEFNDFDYLGIAACEDSKIKEGVGDVLKNIMGYMKLKSLAGKYVKSMADEGIAELDFARRKEASDSKEKTEVLTTAHKAKMDSLKDRTSAITSRIDSIGTTNFLKNFAQKIKYTARIKKNEIILKIASKEEARELKLKNAELTKDLLTINDELREYEKENKDAMADAKKEQAEKLKGEIDKTDKKIKEVQSKIEDLESKLNESAKNIFEEDASDEDKAKAKEEKNKIYGEIAKLKAQKADLIKDLISAKEYYNNLSGKEEYSVDSDNKEIENLEKEAKEYSEKAEKPAEEKPAEEKPEEKPAEEKPAEEKPEEKPAEEDPKIKELEDDLKQRERELEDLKNMKKPNEDSIKNLSQNIETRKNTLNKLKAKKQQMPEGRLFNYSQFINEKLKK